MLVLGGIVAVTFSWLTPEPPSGEHRVPPGVDREVLIKCAEHRSDPAPAYGTRGSPDDGLTGAVALGGGC